MESFIRSKYESRRWALDGPPPTDPAILDNGASAPTSSSPPAPTPLQQHPTSRPTHASSNSLSSRASLAAPVTTRQTHQLLSSNFTNRPTGPVPTSAAPVAPAVQQQKQQPKAPENDLFSLDFHAPAAPAAATAPEPKKDVKQDILSLFSTPHPTAAAAPAAAFNQFNQAAYWGGGAPQQQQPVQQQPQPPAMTGMMGNNGPGMWGVSSGWSGAPALPPQPNVWGAPPPPPSIPQQQMNMFNTNAVWGAPTPAVAAVPASGADLFGSFPTPTQHAQQKDDAFGDIWGGFK